MQNPHPGRDTRYQRGGVPIGLCPLLDGLPWRGGFFRGVVRAFFGGVERLRLPDLLIGLGRRDLSRLLIGEVISGANGGCLVRGANRGCLVRLLIPKRVEKILWGGRVLL